MSNDSKTMATAGAEWLAQERALELQRMAAPGSGDARVDAYRVIYHAIAEAPRSEPPADFAERAARAVREFEIDEHVERWMIRIAGLIGMTAVFVYAGPMLLESLRTSTALAVLPGAGLLTSPLLWATAAGAGTAGVFDFWQKRRHPDSAAHA